MSRKPLLVLRAMQFVACSVSLSCAVTVGPLFLVGVSAQLIQACVALLALAIELSREQSARADNGLPLEEQP